MVSEAFLLRLVEQTLYEFGYADVAKLLLLKQQDPGKNALTNAAMHSSRSPQEHTPVPGPSSPDDDRTESAPPNDDRSEPTPKLQPGTNQPNVSSETVIDSERSTTDPGTANTANRQSETPPHPTPPHLDDETSHSHATSTDTLEREQSVSLVTSSILSGDGLVEAYLSAGWKTACWDSSLVDPCVTRAFLSDDALLLAVLYFVRRNSFFEKVFRRDPNNQDHKSFRLQMLDEAARDLMPLLDYLNNMDSYSLTVFIPQMVREELNRNFESKVFADILEPERPNQSYLVQSKFQFGYAVAPPSRSQSFAFALNHFLLRTILASSIAYTHPILPRGLLQRIVTEAIKYHALTNPYLLPSRTLSPEHLYYNDAALFPTTQISQANDLGHTVFAPQKLFIPNYHTSEVWFCRYSPLGKWLATGSLDGRVIIYDTNDNYRPTKTCRIISEQEAEAYVSTNNVPRPVLANNAVIYCCWDPTDRYLVTCGHDTLVRVWDLHDTFPRPGTLDSARRRVTRSMGPAPNPDTVIDPPERLADVGLLLCFCLGKDTKVWSCEFVPNPTKNCVPRFVVGSPDKSLKLFDIYGTEVYDFYSNIVLGLAEAPVVEALALPKNESNVAASTLIDASLMELDEVDTELIAARIIDARSRITPSQPRSPNLFSRVNDLAMTPDGKLLVVVTNDCEVVIYKIPDLNALDDATTKSLVLSHLKVGKKITSCSVSANGQYFLLSCAPDELQVWDISVVYSYQSSPQHCIPFLHRRLLGFQQLSYIVRSCFGYLDPHSGVEQLVLSGSKDGYICIWNLETGQLISRSPDHRGLCNAVSWNTNGAANPKKHGSRDVGLDWCSVGDDGRVNIFTLY